MLNYIIYNHYNFIFEVCITCEMGRKGPIKYRLYGHTLHGNSTTQQVKFRRQIWLCILRLPEPMK